MPLKELHLNLLKNGTVACFDFDAEMADRAWLNRRCSFFFSFFSKDERKYKKDKNDISNKSYVVYTGYFSMKGKYYYISVLFRYFNKLSN